MSKFTVTGADPDIRKEIKMLMHVQIEGDRGLIINQSIRSDISSSVRHVSCSRSIPQTEWYSLNSNGHGTTLLCWDHLPSDIEVSKHFD